MTLGTFDLTDRMQVSVRGPTGQYPDGECMGVFIGDEDTDDCAYDACPWDRAMDCVAWLVDMELRLHCEGYGNTKFADRPYREVFKDIRESLMSLGDRIVKEEKE